MSPKIRIIFVDDEQLILQGLQRMLRGMREEWDMEFVDSGAKALERLAQRPMDVVVSDMRMPGMNGAELLNRVMELHPKTVRFILSGHSDQELIFKCVGSAHQFMAKPCEAEILKKAIARASAPGCHLGDEQLLALVSKIDLLPSLPALYTALTDLLHGPDVSMEEVGRIVTKDIAMTAKLLKLVNSAFFGLPREISSPAEAASYLGVDVLKTLVLALNVFSQFDTLKLNGFALEALWSHSLLTGDTAKAIALTAQAEKPVVDDAFTGGMLHETGKLVLAANFPALWNQAVGLSEAKHMRLPDAELEIFGSTDAEVGGYLLGLWGLPATVVEAVGFHLNPSGSPGLAFSPLTAVHVADAIVTAQGSPLLGPPSVDMQYLVRLGLSDRLPAWQSAVQACVAKEKAA